MLLRESPIRRRQLPPVLRPRSYRKYIVVIGGNIAANSSGSRSFRYGATRRHVLSLRVAFMDGSIQTFRRGDKIQL